MRSLGLPLPLLGGPPPPSVPVASPSHIICPMQDLGKPAEMAITTAIERTFLDKVGPRLQGQACVNSRAAVPRSRAKQSRKECNQLPPGCQALLWGSVGQGIELPAARACPRQCCACAAPAPNRCHRPSLTLPATGGGRAGPGGHPVRHPVHRGWLRVPQRRRGALQVRVAGPGG